MKRLLLCLLFSGSFSLFAQVRISGKMTDTKNNPLHGASITIRNSYDGTTTDSSGNFSFTTTEKGAQVIEASLSGYNTYEKNIMLDKSEIVLNISVKELITELKAVVITAGAFEASDQKKTTVLSSLDIVTTAGANADVVGALKTLPGTQQVGESEGLFVRGGTATESKIFMDGNLVNNFFYSSVPGFATRGRFNPFLFKGTVFSSGGYSALYGQALSSALILESKDLPERTEADISLSVIGLGGGIQKLGKDKKSAWGVSYNYTNLALAFGIIKQKQDYFTTPVYHQGDANFRIKTKNGMIKYYGYLSWNKLGFRMPDIDSLVLKNAFNIENLNTYQNINWKERIGKGWRSNIGLSYSTNKDDIVSELQDAANTKQIILAPIGYAFKNFLVKNRAQYAQARIVLEKKLKGINTIRFGGEYLYSEEKQEYTAYEGSKFNQNIKDNFVAAFAETDYYITNNIAAKIGGRLEHSAIINRWNVAPRLSVAYKFKDNSQASFAYGIFYQTPETKYLPAASNNLDYARAAHYILQYQKISNDRVFRTELFYKEYHDLFKTTSGSITGRDVAANNNGYGYARGAEIFWRDKKSIKNLDYWVSYSYLDTKRDFLNYPGSIQPSFAATHTASLVLKKFVLPWKTGFNASYSFASGRPYYNLKQDSQGKYIIADEGKTINYNSLGFSVNYLPNLGKKNKKSFIVWVLSVTNVLGQKQIFGYNYSTVNDNKIPVTPAYKRFVYVGCFISFGIDRTQDAINNNL